MRVLSEQATIYNSVGSESDQSPYTGRDHAAWPAREWEFFSNHDICTGLAIILCARQVWFNKKHSCFIYECSLVIYDRVYKITTFTKIFKNIFLCCTSSNKLHSKHFNTYTSNEGLLISIKRQHSLLNI